MNLPPLGNAVGVCQRGGAGLVESKIKNQKSKIKNQELSSVGPTFSSDGTD
jgi:hypothetical protein